MKKDSRPFTRDPAHDSRIAKSVAERALALVPEGSVVGLGSGRAATAFLHALGDRVRAGLQVRGVPTSLATEHLARELGVPLTTLADASSIDVDFDGADEVDPQGNLIKGYGGALVREKIVAAASHQVVILVGEEKLVPVLGSRGKLPVEVLPFALEFCRQRLEPLALRPVVRMLEDSPYVTDNGAWILDCACGPIADPAGLDQELRAIPGVLGTGLFLRMADVVLIGRPSSVETRNIVRDQTRSLGSTQRGPRP